MEFEEFMSFMTRARASVLNQGYQSESAAIANLEAFLIEVLSLNWYENRLAFDVFQPFFLGRPFPTVHQGLHNLKFGSSYRQHVSCRISA